MGRWIRVDVLVHDNPKVVAAGFWGMTVIQAAWRMSKAHDLDGELSDRHWTPQMLLRWTLATPDQLEDIQDGMAACISEGLVETVTRNDRNAFQLHDWDDYQKDPTAAERMRRYRERKKKEKKSNVSARKLDPAPPVTRNGRNVTLQDMTGQDRRMDERGRSSRMERSDSTALSESNEHRDSSIESSDRSAPLVWDLWPIYIEFYNESKGVPPATSSSTQTQLEKLYDYIGQIMDQEQVSSADEDDRHQKTLMFARAVLKKYFESDDEFVVNKAEFSLAYFVSNAMPSLASKVLGK